MVTTRMITTRTAQMKDAPVIARLVQALLEELSGEKVAPLGPVARQILAGQQVVGLLAEAEGRPVGVMMLNRCAAIYAGGSFGEISELYVDPAWRSRGVAAKLLVAAREVARREGWTRLEVGAPDQPAWARTLAFYQREGFDEVGPRLRWLAGDKPGQSSPFSAN